MKLKPFYYFAMVALALGVATSLVGCGGGGIAAPFVSPITRQYEGDWYGDSVVTSSPTQPVGQMRLNFLPSGKIGGFIPLHENSLTTNDFPWIRAQMTGDNSFTGTLQNTPRNKEVAISGTLQLEDGNLVGKYRYYSPSIKDDVEVSFRTDREFRGDPYNYLSE